MAKNNSSKHYDAFRMNQSPDSKQPKSVWKKVWKWIKIVFIILFISIGLVGCVQSMTGKSGTKVGSGQEVYSKSDYVSPNIVTMRWNKAKNEFYVPNINESAGVIVNTYLGLEDPEQIKLLKEQDAKNGGQYGIYGGSSFALQLQKPTNLEVPFDEKSKNWTNISKIEIKNEPGKKGVVYGNGKNYIYMNFGNDKGVGKTKTYTPVNKLIDVYVPISIIFETYQKIQKDPKSGKATPIPHNDYTHMKEMQLAKTSLASIGGSEIYNTLLADIFSTLLVETFSTWLNDSKNRSNFANAVSKRNGKTIAELKALPKHELVNEWNKYILSFKNLIGPAQGLTKEEGQALNTLFLSTAAMMQNYLSIASFSKTNYKVMDAEYGKEINTYYVSSINKAGNYKPEAWKYRMFSSDSLVPQKPISTYKEYWQQGPFYGMFVYPFEHFMMSIIRGLGTTGWSIILALFITVIIVRLVTFFVSAKSIFSTNKMEELNQKKAKIEAKYEAYKYDKQMQQRKQMEISELYKKENVSPLAQLVSSLITLPILIVVFRIVSTAPEIKQATLYSIQLSATSISRLFKLGEMQYLPIVILSAGIQLLAQFMPKILRMKRKKSLRADAYQRAAMKKSNKKALLIPLIFVVIGLFFSAGLQIYWIIGGLFTIVQHIAVHYIQKTKWYKNKLEPFLFKKATA
ncbi:membrane protein insertase YidC [Metamycoplasma phocicerebrale]|uniref:Membrane protein insertase YidC n=1 Tax=Metamycoplasma phocicerebrale TaxID=142649 RepID=A0A3T0TTL8_9BACT|nr:membrane protein insertase YidC [Metamycoplasma phocicerebrale]AZZ65384.1 membrane protein insertase YidC [Metamycoplasma phocicerebrale]